MTTIRLTSTSVYAYGHTDRDVCIAVSAMVQTAGSILDELGLAARIECDEARGLYIAEASDYSPVVHAIFRALSTQLRELSDDHPNRIELVA